MKHIIITGAGGLVATELIFLLLKKTDARLYLLSTHEDVISERYKDYCDRVCCFTLRSFSTYVLSTDEQFDVCIHTAFSRSSEGHRISESIDYLKALISLLKQSSLKYFVNISSQSIYGKNSGLMSTEATPINPDYLYAMGKYLSEIVTELMLDGTEIKWTNIRLCSVCENARFIRIFVQNAISGDKIVLSAPDQKVSFIDVRDVADALVALIYHTDSEDLAPVYNLGANLVNTIKEIAVIVKTIGESEYGLDDIDIVIESSSNTNCIGMDASLFMSTFSWHPKRDIKDMAKSLYEMMLAQNGGGTLLALK